LIKDKVLRIIDTGEGLRTEFKECRNSIPKTLYETVCAFLNRNGGEILLGVNNKGKITGIDKESIDKIQSDFTTTINNPGKISPSVYLSIEQVQIDGKLVLYIYIPESSQVHKCNGRIYDRSFDGDLDITDNHQLVTSLYINKQTSYTENRVYPYCEIVDLDSELLTRARRQAVLLRNNHPWQSMDDFEMLKSAQVYTKDYQSGREGFTLAAILLFGKDQTILSALPHHRTDLIVRRENVDRYDDRDDVRTNLLDSYDRITAFAQKHLPDPFYMEGSRRISIRDAIIREIASNILIHREYMNAFPAKIIIEKTRIYAENGNKPHGMGPINPDKFTPYPKNPIIARFFKEIGLADELGSGVRNLIKFVKIYSQSKPQLIEDDVFKVSIPVLPQRGDTVSCMIIRQDERMRMLLEYCQKARTRDEIQTFLNLKNRDYVRNFIIKPLLENGLLFLTNPENPNDPRQQYYSPPVTEGVTPPANEGVTTPVTEGVTPSNSSKNGSPPPVTEGVTMQATMQATMQVTMQATPQLPLQLPGKLQDQKAGLMIW
jgi:ATP-dependent DNA helicase RecG